MSAPKTLALLKDSPLDGERFVFVIECTCPNVFR